MIEIDITESLNLYFYLSKQLNLSEALDSILCKLEQELFDKLSVKDVEGFRCIFNDKGML